MLTYTKQRNTFGNLANVSDSTTLSIADDLINDRTRFIVSARPWWFLEKAFTMTTVASTQFYALPGQVDRIISSPYVTVGSVNYTPREAPSREFWDNLNLVTYSSQIPEWWYQYGTTLGFFPTPSASSNTITVNAKQKVIDLSLADYTTGTITTIANGGTAVTGSGTSWNASMVGQYIRIDPGTAANKGDGTWYMISAVGSATTLTLANAYGGTAIAAGSATYTIGQASILPEAYQMLPVFLALEIYFTSIDPKPQNAQLYQGKGADMMQQMVRDQSNKTGGRVLDEGIDKTTLINPNLTIGF